MRIWFALLNIAVGITTASNCWSAPITFNTALPVGDGEFVARSLVVVNQSGKDPSNADRDRRATSLVSVLGYGATNKLALFGVVPYVDKDLDVTVGGNRINRSESGLGDVSVFGRYTVAQHDQLGRTFRIAPFFGVKAPTGEDDVRDRFGRLPPSVQPGSGSWDIFGGIVSTYQTLDFQTDGQVSYRINNEANNFEAGNVFRFDGSLQYRLSPRTLEGDGVPNFLYGVLETNIIHRDKNKVNGTNNENSGGTTVFLSPGLQYVTKRLIVEGVVQLPVIQDLNGNELENDYVVRAGIRFNF